MPDLAQTLRESGRQYLIDQYGGVDKIPASELGLGSSGSGGSFEFDYEAEARKAYGELGVYYDRILRESEGDLNKALARLTQDYERGLRIKREDTATAREGVDLAQQEAERQRRISQENLRKNTIANAQSRGLFTKSMFDTTSGDMQGFGIPSENYNRSEANLWDAFNYGTNARKRQKSQLDLGLSRFEEQTGINKTRSEEDKKTALERKKFDLEQQRRTEAASMANERGARAYQKWQYSNLV